MILDFQIPLLERVYPPPLISKKTEHLLALLKRENFHLKNPRIDTPEECTETTIGLLRQMDKMLE